MTRSRKNKLNQIAVKLLGQGYHRLQDNLRDVQTVVYGETRELLTIDDCAIVADHLKKLLRRKK